MYRTPRLVGVVGTAKPVAGVLKSHVNGSVTVGAGVVGAAVPEVSI